MASRFPTPSGEGSLRDLVSSSLHAIYRGEPPFDYEDKSGQLIRCFTSMPYTPHIAPHAFELQKSIYSPETLPARTRQVGILAVAATFDAPYIIYCHTAMSTKLGLTDEQFQDAISGRSPTGISEEEMVAYETALLLARDRKALSDISPAAGLPTKAHQSRINPFSIMPTLPTPEEIHYMQEHIHETKAPEIIACITAPLIVTTVVVALRFVSRKLSHVPITSSDWWIVVALLTVVVSNYGNYRQGGYPPQGYNNGGNNGYGPQQGHGGAANEYYGGGGGGGPPQGYPPQQPHHQQNFGGCPGYGAEPPQYQQYPSAASHSSNSGRNSENQGYQNQYGGQGDPEGDRGIMGGLAGGAAGAYGGHALGGKAGHGTSGTIIGAIAGAFAGHKTQDAAEDWKHKHDDKKEEEKRKNHEQ
ncbi:hypothetical protein CC80DRAFT_598748 [Byssothecium circinans]|uniref:Carboxymuconolactone decarboxylase-like domain-containing protein n=1 Tax=Byssothecium circinans TaxID=147558 RepID=A0A6A5TB90_9PLEO|nr:hypothetical protein CC80DRAFT_598748 [Byssothecium circinans]